MITWRVCTGAALVLVGAAVPGCGGGGGGNDSTQIHQLITDVTTLKSADLCTKDFTDQGREQFFQAASVAAGKKDCSDSVGKPHPPASALHVGTISVSGSTASVSVTVKGTAAKVGLVKQGGWKLNSIAAGTSAASTPPSPTSTSPTPRGTVSPSQNAETKAAATCLQSKGTGIKGSQLYGKPAILARLRSGNVIALVLYGPAGGALQGEQTVRKANPTYDTYSSPNGKVLIFYAHKASKADFNIGNGCQMQAAAAG